MKLANEWIPSSVGNRVPRTPPFDRFRPGRWMRYFHEGRKGRRRKSARFAEDNHCKWLCLETHPPVGDNIQLGVLGPGSVHCPKQGATAVTHAKPLFLKLSCLSTLVDGFLFQLPHWILFLLQSKSLSNGMV